MASINISYDSPEKEFEGILSCKNGDETLFRGKAVKSLRIPSKNEQEELSVVAPDCLTAFFPSGKILPNHLPECLKECVKVIPVGNDVDLDVNIDKLYIVTHNEALERINAKDYANAEKFLFNAAKLSPKSAVVQYNLGCCYALWDKSELALKHLRKALNFGYTDGEEMAKDDDLSSLLTSSDFWDLVELMNSRKSK